MAAALASKGFLPEAIEPAVEELIEEKLLDDARYATSLVRVLSGRGQGPLRVRQALSEASLPAALIEEALAEAPDWGTLAAEVRRRRFGEELPDEWSERARQMRFLQYRGFSGDHISHALARSATDEAPPGSD